MKRIFFTVALATLTLGAAQASTLNWDALSKVDGYTSLGTKTAGGETAVALGNSASWTVACKVTSGTVNDMAAVTTIPPSSVSRRGLLAMMWQASVGTLIVSTLR